MPMVDAATIPEVGLTSLFSLKRTAAAPGTPLPTGNPWTKSNLTVVITAGSGGTGSIGIELAKAWGAAHIATSTSGAAGIAFVKELGATFVTDYKVQDIFDALPDDSVDIVYDKYVAG
jgi:NADPH:quinone reductase-like Zn-dependent oxidoreductase